MKALPTLVIAAACTALTVPLCAQEPDGSSTATTSLPELHTENGVKFMCGGIGMTEAARMKQISPDYELMLTFAANNGAYLTDIDVEIANAKGNKLVATTCNGPIMLVDVPASGTYRVTATTEGHRVARSARVSDGQGVKQLSITWPARLVERAAAQP